MLAKVKRDIRQSEVRRFRQSLDRTDARLRPLSPAEIAALESQGNSCEDWSRVSAAPDFSPERVRNCAFEGDVALPAFFGTVRLPEGVSVPTGLWNCTVKDSSIGNSHLRDVGVLSRMVVQQGCVVRNVGSLSATGRTAFGIGRQLSIGMEVGGRTIISYPEMDLETATGILLNKDDAALQDEYQRTIEEFREEIRCDRGFVGADACVVNSQALRNVWIGPGAKIDGAAKIVDSCLLSSVARPATVRDGAIVEHSVLQWGSTAESHAWIRDSVLLETASAGRGARIRHSVLAPNARVTCAEVSSSLLGPFVGMHHQAQVVSVLWPAGLGSVEAGCLVGNDTSGRFPNREAILGEGVSFGLGATALFPLNLERAPWTFVEARALLRPQRMCFPFSLVRTPTRVPEGLDGGLNELLPGWALRDNPLALARAARKFAERDKTRRRTAEAHFLTRRSAEAAIRALQRLNSVSEPKDVYVERDIPGLGANFLREAERQRAIRTYGLFLERYALTAAMTTLEENPELLKSGQPVAKLLFGKETLRDVCRLVKIPAQLVLIIRRYRQVEKDWRDSILDALRKERELGSSVFDDWRETHPDELQGMGFVQDEVKESDRRVRILLGQLRAMKG
ncbi:MAG: DUF4954 family protein [Fibrobacterales bacterium]|nr:DUF4954 family protein [Fibrobacterales bacterium]MBP5188044.1 DUF4954 family protein [Fibrobacterales bacterium]MBP5351150.1 DUF4954 family protein [Fibrobacterales bacterium]